MQFCSGRPGQLNGGCQCASGFGRFVIGNGNPLKHFFSLLRFQPRKTLTVKLRPVPMCHMPASTVEVDTLLALLNN
jgi:hypothetical protein